MIPTTQTDQTTTESDSGPVHLSETGFNAGRRLCESMEGRSVHAMYAPLANPVFRAKCCPACLKVWANQAYDEGDEMPDYIRELREKPV